MATSTNKSHISSIVTNDLNNTSPCWQMIHLVTFKYLLTLQGRLDNSNIRLKLHNFTRSNDFNSSSTTSRSRKDVILLDSIGDEHYSTGVLAHFVKCY